MTYKLISTEYAGFAFQQFEMPMSTIALIDLDQKTYETMALHLFLENNEHTFTPYETLNLISSLFFEGSFDLAIAMGQNYRLVLYDLCVNNQEQFEFANIEHEVDHLAGLQCIDWSPKTRVA